MNYLRVKRRQFVFTVGAGAIVSTAGCLSSSQTDPTDGATTGSPEQSTSQQSTSGQISSVETGRNAINIGIEDSSSVSYVNVFHEDELVRYGRVNTGEETVSLSLFTGENSGPWEYPNTDRGSSSYRAGTYRIVAVNNNEEEVGSAELSLEPELEVMNVQTARAFEDNDRFRTDAGVEDMYEADREKFFDGTVVFELENRGNAPELAQSLVLTQAESAEITYHGSGFSEDSTGDTSFLNWPAYTDNWELGLIRWWDDSEQDLDGYPDTHILEPNQTGYFLTNSIMYGNTGLDPVEDSVESVCQSGTELDIEGSVNGAAGDPIQIRLTRELTGEAVLYEENYRTDFWCRGQTLSLSDSSSGNQ